MDNNSENCNPFDPREIAIDTKPMPIDVLLRRLLQGTILLSRPLKKRHSSQSTQHYVGCPKGSHSEWPAIGRNVLIKIFSRMEEHPHDS